MLTISNRNITLTLTANRVLVICSNTFRLFIYRESAIFGEYPGFNSRTLTKNIKHASVNYTHSLLRIQLVSLDVQQRTFFCKSVLFMHSLSKSLTGRGGGGGMGYSIGMIYLRWFGPVWAIPYIYQRML